MEGLTRAPTLCTHHYHHHPPLPHAHPARTKRFRSQSTTQYRNHTPRKPSHKTRRTVLPNPHLRRHPRQHTRPQSHPIHHPENPPLLSTTRLRPASPHRQNHRHPSRGAAHNRRRRSNPKTEAPNRPLHERNRSGSELPQPNNTPNSPGSSIVTGKYLLQTITALGIVIGLLFLIKFLYAKATGHVTTSNPTAVQVLARTSIAPRNHIVILRVGSRILICSDSAHGTRTLSEITDPQEVAQLLAETSAAKENSISKSFNNMLGRYGADYDHKGRHPDEGLDTVEFQSDSARESVSKLLSRVRDLSSKGGRK